MLIYAVCLQCCWSNRRCPWFLDKDEPSSAKDMYSFCPCVQGLQSPDSWQSADLEQVVTCQESDGNIFDSTSLSFDDPLALVFVNMNVKVVVCNCGKTYKMSPELARKYQNQQQSRSDVSTTADATAATTTTTTTTTTTAVISNEKSNSCQKHHYKSESFERYWYCYTFQNQQTPP